MLHLRRHHFVTIALAGWTGLAVAQTAPTISSFSPPAGTVTTLTSIAVTFSKPVTNVVSDVFLINSASADGVTGSGSNYTFTFEQPANGTITVSWSAEANIADTETPSHAFNPTNTWQYNLIDNVAPTVQDQAPPAGATVRTFTQLEVHFSEPVSGVEASDLLVNGEAADELVILGPDRYLFQFPQPPTGAVQVAWAPGHGIQDWATPPNAFAGGTWTNVLNPGAGLARIRINEFLTGNFNTNNLKDQFGELEDWIELYNYDSTSINLEGYSLTDDPDFPGKWVFPAVTLNAGSYLVVFASGRDLTAVGGTNRLHTSFTLNSKGEYLGLYNAESPRAVLSEFAPEYPEQRNDYSFGYDTTNALKYFATQTPGAYNGSSSITGAVAEVHFSVDHGFFNQPFTLVLDTATPGATIRFTTNGTPPTESSGAVYTGPLVVDRTTILRALAYQANMLPSHVGTRTYLFPSNVLSQPSNPPGFSTTNIWNLSGQTADFAVDPRVVTNALHKDTIIGDLLDIPSLSIVVDYGDMFGRTGFIGIYPNTTANVLTEVPCSVELINPDGSEGFQIDTGIRQHGGSSRNNPMKKSFTLKFRGKYGDAKLRYQLFPDSPTTEFNSIVLRGGYNNSWVHSSAADQRARATMVRDPFCKDLHGAMGNIQVHNRYVHLYINGLYWGVYNPSEDPDNDFAAAYLGGDNDNYDAIKAASSQLSVDGDLVAYNAMVALCNSGLASLSQYTQMLAYLDVTQFADYMLVNLYGANNDWASQNNWATVRRRETNATFKFVCWDEERTLEGTNESRIGTSPVNGNLQGSLMYSAEYKLLFADRVHRHMFNNGVMTPTNMASLWRKRAVQIDRAVVGETARWGDAAYGGKPALSPLPYPGYTAGFPYTREENWLGEQGRLYTNYFPVRTAILLNQLRTAGWYPTVDAPEFNQNGGRVASGFNLVITSGASTIYYTTDGADPRVFGTGSVSSSATAYSSPITLASNVVVKARVRNGSTWSALTEAEFTVGGLGVPLRFTEIMYNPSPGGSAGDPYEYVELQNIGGTPVDLSGDYFDGITFVFPSGTTLAPGARLIVGASDNTNAFKLRYPAATNIAGWFTGRLSNSGEKISLLSVSGQIIISVTYGDSDGWDTQADGGGYSLEIIDTAGDQNDPANWRIGTSTNGTPGLPASTPPTATILINEIMAENLSAVTNGGTLPDWVELYNPGASPVNLANWSLTDSGDARKFVFPSTSIPAGGYLVVWCDDTTNTSPGLHTGFSLNRDGESVYLYDSTTSRVDAVSFGLQLSDYTVGRVGGTWQLTVPTPNATNVAASVALQTNLIVNEWMANPLTGESDWFELYNRTNLPVALRGLYVGTSNALFQIASLSFVPAGGFVQLMADETAGAGHVDFKLPAAGTRISLYDSTGLLFQQVTYGAQDDAGVSEGRLPDGSATISAFPGSASPAASNYLLNYTGAIINEVMARYDSITNGSDWVELYNPTTSTFDLSGMGLSDEPGEPTRWVFPSGVTLNSNSYLRVWFDGSRAASTTAGTDLNTGHALSGDSGGVYLYNTAGQPVDLVEYGFQIKNQTIGRSGGIWRLLATPTPGTNNSAPATLGSVTSVRLNEWMASASDGGDDWFELYNTNTLPVSLAGLYITDDPSLVGQIKSPIGALSFIAPRNWVKFVADDHPGSGRDHVSFHLDEQGESLLLYTTNLTLIDGVAFGEQTEDVSQGRLADGGTNIVSFPATPTPGNANYLPLGSVVINEVLTHTDPPLTDALELFNPNVTNVNIGGWYISNSGDDLKRFRVPDGTIVPAGGFKVFYETDFSGGTGSLTPFTFNSAHGDQAWLSEALADGTLTGYRAGVDFGAAENGVSFGRFQTSVGVDFTAQSAHTFGVDSPATTNQFIAGTGKTNAYPKVGPVVINEIMFHPPDLAEGTNRMDDSTNEFVEILNTGGSSVALYDTAATTNTWSLANALAYTFPTGITLGAGESVLIVNFNPTNTAVSNAFRSKYSITNSVRLFGPFDGKLDNSGETIELYKPDAVQQAPHPDAGYVPQVLVEKVSYQDAAPWPGGATDGGGLSLQRSSTSLYGNEPTNWVAGVPTPGAGSGPAATAPVITSLFGSLGVPAGTNLLLTATATGTTPITWQWYYNDVAVIGATGTNLSLTYLQPTNSGRYSMLATNIMGYDYQDVVNLTVLAPSPAALSLTLASVDQMTFNWPSNGLAYTLYSTTNLEPAVWVPVDVAPTFSGGTFQIIINRSNAQQFYRLSQP